MKTTHLLLRIFTVFFMVVISLFVFTSSYGSEPDSITSGHAIVLHSDTIQLHLNTKPVNEPSSDDWQKTLQVFVGLLISIYEFIIRIIPTAHNYSLLHKIIEVLQWLSNLLNRKKRTKTHKSTVHAPNNYREDF
jgi:hypothetical protein